MLQQHEIAMFQYPAQQFCHRIGEDPYQQMQDENGYYYPRWMDAAQRMAELALMMRLLNEHGLG